MEGFIVQFGIAGDPLVSNTWKNRFMPDDAVRTSNLKGTISYAFTEPNTHSTQVFINMGENARLDSGGFAPFGKVTKGMKVVEALYTDYGEKSGGGLRRGDQSKIFENGNIYLDQKFPLLDKIITVTIIEQKND